MRRVGTEDDEPEPEPWPAGTKHFVVLHKEILITNAVEPDPDDPDDRGTVAYEKGDEIPPEHVTPGLWRGCSDRLAALNAHGERLDSRSLGERRGSIDSEAALRAWRRENNLRRRTVQVFECGECGETFETVDALNGHQSIHVKGGGDDSDDSNDPDDEDGDAEGGPSTETLADRLDAEQGGETA